MVRAQRIVRNAANAAGTRECRRACPALHLSWRLRSPALLWTNILRVIQCVVFIHTSMFGKPNVVYEETRPLFIYKYACDFAVVSRARRNMSIKLGARSSSPNGSWPSLLKTNSQFAHFKTCLTVPLSICTVKTSRMQRALRINGYQDGGCDWDKRCWRREKSATKVPQNRQRDPMTYLACKWTLLALNVILYHCRTHITKKERVLRKKQLRVTCARLYSSIWNRCT